MKQGSAAFYLPAKHELIFKKSKNGFSTGQQSFNILDELFIHLKEPILLLDEWDANLDSINKIKLSKLIDQIALNKCVIEIRH